LLIARRLSSRKRVVNVHRSTTTVADAFASHSQLHPSSPTLTLIYRKSYQILTTSHTAREDASELRGFDLEAFLQPRARGRCVFVEAAIANFHQINS